tara:strand:+ start:68058 stop:68738 length:681 start_codon:yes stop_codon:yes gene_type:complete
MFSIKNLTSLFFIFISYQAFSQHDFDALGESAFAINHKVSKNYTVSFSLRSRYFLYRNAKFQFEQQQVDLFHFSTFKLNDSYKLSAGVYYRNRDFFDTGSDELRFMQQFIYTKQLKKLRFRHRFRAEQRILDSQTIFRQRYRFAIDCPLKGETLDVGEPFIFNALEGLCSLSKVSAPEIDARATTKIGWQISRNLKLQTGLEYRLEAFNLVAKNYLFVLTSGVLRI